MSAVARMCTIGVMVLGVGCVESAGSAPSGGLDRPNSVGWCVAVGSPADETPCGVRPSYYTRAKVAPSQRALTPSAWRDLADPNGFPFRNPGPAAFCQNQILRAP